MSTQDITEAAEKAWQASTRTRLIGVSYQDWLEHQKAVLGLFWGSL